MPTNNFKPFATGTGANVMGQADWEALAALTTGFQSGKASSAQVNKAIRQALFIASALAQYTADKSGQNVLDDGDVAGFITKMHTAFSTDFQSLDATLTALAGLAGGANKLPYFTGVDALAQTDITSIGRDIIGQTSISNVLSYLTAAPLSSPALTGIPTAPTAATGTNTTQLATTAFVQSALTALLPKRSFIAGDYIRIPDVNNGLIIQWGSKLLNPNAGTTVNFAMVFPTICLGIIMSPNDSDTSVAYRVSATNASTSGFTGVTTKSQSTSITYIAIGY